VACGDQHSACITTSNELYTWGNGDYYRLGNGVGIDELIPSKLETLQDYYVTDVSCGMTHTLCITNEGCIYAFGSGQFGKLG